MSHKLDLDDLLEGAPRVSVTYYRHRGDRRAMSRSDHSMEEHYLTLKAEVSLVEDDPRLPQIALALAGALARFGL